MKIEICAFSLESCRNAQMAGADRMELCGGLLEGGTTPSHGLIELARGLISVELYVMIRPRGGDFCYDETEFEVMKRDILAAKQLKANGVVLGILLPNGQIDVARTRELVALAKPLETTFHRAFDRALEPFTALEAIIKTGAVRLLTSGQKATAIEGKNLLTQLVAQANGRIEIMAGSGVNAQNALELAQTGVQALHLTAKSARESKMEFRNDSLNMASVSVINEHEVVFSDVSKIETIRATVLAHV